MYALYWCCKHTNHSLAASKMVEVFTMPGDVVGHLKMNSIAERISLLFSFLIFISYIVYCVSVPELRL